MWQAVPSAWAGTSTEGGREAQSGILEAVLVLPNSTQPRDPPQQVWTVWGCRHPGILPCWHLGAETFLFLTILLT